MRRLKIFFRFPFTRIFLALRIERFSEEIKYLTFVTKVFNRYKTPPYQYVDIVDREIFELSQIR